MSSHYIIWFCILQNKIQMKKHKLKEYIDLQKLKFCQFLGVGPNNALRLKLSAVFANEHQLLLPALRAARAR